ncbi:MAG: S8 family serine peptidase [Cyanothece sp. SIO1E1]|nr:S8 family serine peptidase [Cyanothece sp. SIO1E1]
MRKLACVLFSFSLLASLAMAQEPGQPNRANILTEDSKIIQETKAAAEKAVAPKGVAAVPVQKSKVSPGKKIPNSYVVVLKDDFVAPFATTKSAKATSRASQAAAAKKHQAGAEKKIRKYATETLGLSNDEIGEIFTGIQSGFTVKLKPKKSGAGAWLTRAKSAKNTAEAFQDQEMEGSLVSAGPIVDQYSPEAWAGQYADYSNWVGGGCDCTGYNRWIWVLDSGIDLNHPDLNVNRGYAKTYVPGTTSAEDDHGHGTHVAGIAAAKNNGYGALGIAHGATVVPVKVLNSSNRGYYSWFLAGLNWVYQNSLAGDVVNFSIGGRISASAPETVVEKAIKKLGAKGVYVVIAAGNDKIHSRGYHPARLNASKVYTIAATQQGVFWWWNLFADQFSNYGKPPVDFAAPGNNIYSTYKNGGYRYMSGTSMAAPNFSGVLLCGIKRKKGYNFYKVQPHSHNLYIVRPK